MPPILAKKDSRSHLYGQPSFDKFYAGVFMLATLVVLLVVTYIYSLVGYKDAVDNNRHSFTEGNKTYFFDDADGVVFYDATEAAIATKVSFTAYSDDIKFTYDFYRSAIIAMGKNESTFASEGKNYSVTQDGSSALISLDGKEYAFI